MSKIKSFVKRHKTAFTIGGFGLIGVMGFLLGRKYENGRLGCFVNSNAFSEAENVIDARMRFTK